MLLNLLVYKTNQNPISIKTNIETIRVLATRGILTNYTISILTNAMAQVSCTNLDFYTIASSVISMLIFPVVCLLFDSCEWDLQLKVSVKPKTRCVYPPISWDWKLSPLEPFHFGPPDHLVNPISMMALSSPTQEDDSSDGVCGDELTPSSTPKKQKVKHRQISSSQPTMSHHLKPGDKVTTTRRIRSLSDTSDLCVSGSDVSSSKSSSTRSKSKTSSSGPKLISESGTYLLDRKQTCQFSYMEQFINEEESDSLRDFISSAVANMPSRILLEMEPAASPSPHPADESLTKLLKFYATKVEMAVGTLFDTKLNVSRVLVRNLLTSKDAVSYETFDVNGSNPVVSILSVGAPRPLSLKTSKGKRITHKVPLHSGSLSVLSAETSHRYLHSIQAGGKNTGQHVALFFIGSPSVNGASDSAPSSDNGCDDIDTNEEETEVSESDIQSEDSASRGVVEEFSLFDELKQAEDLTLPQILVTPASDSIAPASQNQGSDLLSPISPNPANQTVIAVNNAFSDNPSDCMGSSKYTEPPPSTSDTTKFFSSIEKTLISLSKNMETVMNDVDILKRQQAAQHDTPDSSTRKSHVVKEMKGFQDWWRSNVSSMKDMKHEIDETCKRIEDAHNQAAEIFESVKETKADLKQWHNSVFCKEDSEMLEKIYNRLNDEKDDLCNCPANMGEADLSKTSTLETQHVPPDEFRDSEDWLHSSRRNMWDYPPLTRSAPQKIFGSYSSAIAERPSSSRRTPGFSITYAAKAPKRCGYSTVAATPAPISGPQNSAAARYVTRDTNIDDNPDNTRRRHDNNDNNTSGQSHSAQHYPAHAHNAHHNTSDRDWTRPAPKQNAVKDRPPPKALDQRPVYRPHADDYKSSSYTHRSDARSMNRSDTVTTPKAREFTTVLITDSIMKNIKLNDLGVNHKIHMIRKTDSAGLAHIDVRNALKRLNPDFIYVHIGINDIFAQRSINSIMINFGNLVIVRDQVARGAKIIFSLPLLTDDTLTNRWVEKLRQAIVVLTNNLAYSTRDEGLKFRELLINDNYNLDEGDDLYEEGGIHLSARGLRVIRSNFRCGIHTLTRAILGKPLQRPDRGSHY